MQAATKYVLGELPQALRDEYEEHYFDCAECALDVRAAAVFSDNARNVLCQAEREASLKATTRARGRWLAWLRPVVAVPAFAVLLIVVAYQNVVTIPRAKQEAERGAGQVFTSVFSLQMANTRGGEEVKVLIRPNEAFALDFDFSPTRSFDSYLCQLQDATGGSLLQVSVPGSEANTEVHLIVPGGLAKPGKYALVFAGDPGARGKMTKQNEVSRIPFAVEFHP